MFGEERRCSEAASQIDFTSAWRERERVCVYVCVLGAGDSVAET